jgi:hypothetical protein
MSNELNATAVRIAAQLLALLRAGELPAVGIDQIEEACARENVRDLEKLVELTARAVVEGAGRDYEEPPCRKEPPLRAVLYDRETMEPLTVLQIPGDLVRMAKTGAALRFPAWPVVPSWFREAPLQDTIRMDLCEVRLEPVMRREPGGEPEVWLWIATTTTPEAALLARAAYLPGQRTEMMRRAIATGVVGL